MNALTRDIVAATTTTSSAEAGAARRPSWPSRLGIAEALGYAGAAVVLAGVCYGVLSSTVGTTAAALVLALAVAATVTAALLRRPHHAGTLPAADVARAMRAAGSARAMRAAGCAGALRAAGVAAAFAAVLYGIGVGEAVLSAQTASGDLTGVIIAAASATTLSALLGLVVVPTTLLAAVFVLAAEVAIFAAVSLGGNALTTSGLAPIGSTVLLLGVSLWRRIGSSAPAIRVIALLLAPPALLIIAQFDEAPTWALVGIAALIAAGSMAASVRWPRPSLAVVGGFGILGVALDIPARLVQANGGAAVALVAAGLALIGSAAVVNVVVRRSRALPRGGPHGTDAAQTSLPSLSA